MTAHCEVYSLISGALALSTPLCGSSNKASLPCTPWVLVFVVVRVVVGLGGQCVPRQTLSFEQLLSSWRRLNVIVARLFETQRMVAKVPEDLVVMGSM